MTVNAYAKINWTLNVLGKRPDGYHELDMLMQSIDLCDEIDFEPADELSLVITGPEAGDLRADESNLMLRAARLLRRETGATGGARMRLFKRIPMQAGMGGGSGDAAAVLKQLNRMWGTGLSQDELCAIGVRLGADIPYCITGGLCRAQGLGERLTRVDGAPQVSLLIAMPAAGLSTKDVFAGGGARPRQDMARAQCELCAGNWDWLDTHTANDLQPTAALLRPEIEVCVRRMRECGAKFARMTGSGSAVYGVFDDAQTAQALEALRGEYPDIRMARTIAD